MRRQEWQASGIVLVLLGRFAFAASAAEPGPASSDSQAPASEIKELPPTDPGNAREEDLHELRRRLDRAQADIAELRAQQAGGQTADRPPGIAGTDRPVSMQQGRTGPLERGVEDRIRGLPAPEGQSRPLERGVEDRIRDVLAAMQKNQYPFVRISGFLDVDSDNYQQDAASLRQLGDVQNGTGIRRARLQALGKVMEYTNFSLELEFAGAGRPSLYDLWGEQVNLPTGAVRIGQYRQPVTMDSWTSARHLEFMERSAPFQAFDPFRRIGIMDWWVSEDQRTLLAASLYSTGGTFWNTTSSTTQYASNGDDRYGTQIGDNGGVGVALRATHLMYYDDYTGGRRLLHVGGGYNFAEIGGNGVDAAGTTGSQTWRATAQPETFMGDSTGSGSTFAGTPNVLDTGRILAHNYSLLHAELAGNHGSAHFQSEWMGDFVNQYGGPVLFYSGAYAQAGYFLTGETAGYNKLTGAMDYNVKPFSEFLGLGHRRGICGWGAWEAAGRWSYLDLQNGRVNPANYQNVTSLTASNGGAGPSTSHPNPGILNDATLALNWWWNQYTRVEFDYIVSMLDSQYHGSSRMETYAMRFQIEF